jgi:RHS repeat-associated protein
LGDSNAYFYRVFRKSFTDGLFLYHADHLGTPVAMTDGTGAVVWRAEHLPFGGIHSLPVSMVTNNLRFPGQYFDPETGLNQNFFRDYDAATGRYREPDPMADLSHRSLQSPTFDTELLSPWYTYVGANPTNYIDPLGLLRFKGCLPERELAIKSALKDYCSRIETPSFIGCMCSKTSIPDRLKRQCEDEDLTVRCKPPTSGGLCRGVCAWSIPFGNTIRLCERAWQPERCGPLGCTLVHEMTHQIGHFREKRPRQVESCLGCR